MARLAQGCALVLAALTLLVMASSASANTITTIAGGGTNAPPGYDQPPEAGGFVYANPLDVDLHHPTSVAWSGDPKGLFYIMPGDNQCAQLWMDPDPTTDEYGLAVEGGLLGNCNPLPNGYFPPRPIIGGDYTANQVLLKNPCCVTSDWHWDRTDATAGPLVASTDSGHVQFYSWKTNTGFTKAGSSPPAACATTPADTDVAPTAAHLCNVNALAQQGFSSSLLHGWYAFAEYGRNGNATTLYWVDTTPTLQSVVLNPLDPTRPLGVGGLAWDDVGNAPGLVNAGLVISDGLSAIHRLQRLAGFPGSWNPQLIAGTRGGTPGFSGDGGPPGSAQFNNPTGLAVGFDRALYIADTGNCRIRKLSRITPAISSTETVTTVAGNGCNGSAALGDGGIATEANLDHPLSVAMAPQGLLIADTGHEVIRLIDRTSIVKPAAITADNTPSFDIRSLDTPSNVQCKVDSSVVPCDGIGPLTDGVHKLEAVENGSPGDPTRPADPTPAVANFTVDTTAPGDLTLGTPAADATGVPIDTDFTWTPGSDTHAGIDHYELWIDGTKDRDIAIDACAGDTCAAKAVRGLADPAAMAEGAHTWQVRAVDGVGNTASTETRSVNLGGAPKAAFTISPNPALAGRSVTFNGGTSADESGIAKYEWDLDGDGAFETNSGANPATARIYQAPTTLTVRLRVTDGVGKQATAQQQLRVSTPTGSQNLLGISINSGAQYTRTTEVTLLVKPPPSATSILASNDGGFLAPQTFPVANSIRWRLQSSGPERLPKTVYARFRLGPIISETYTDDIILDEKPPVVQQASLFGLRISATGSAQAAKTRAFKLRIRARDTNSGVSGVQVTANKRKPGKVLRYKTRLTVRSAARPKFVRARDRAGNLSGWKKLR